MNGVEMFPSPIYGASFKHNDEVTLVDENLEFPSPINGASFKHNTQKLNQYGRLVSVPYIRG